MKKFKKIRFMYIFLGLSLVSLASVGFANWVIINTEKTTQAINATIGAVNDSNIKASIVPENEQGTGSDFNVKFDSKKDDNTGLITSGTDDYEKLDFKVVLTIDKGGIANFSSIAFKTFSTVASLITSSTLKLYTPGIEVTSFLMPFPSHTNSG